MKRFTCLAALALITTAVLAQPVPTTINYQGRLTDNSSSQIPVDGTVSLAFAIYDNISGGTSLWSETWPSVVVVNGIFNVQLGSNSRPLPPSVFAGGSARYLEIIADEETLTPRQPIGAVGFADMAADSAALGGVASDSWQRALSSPCPSGEFLSGFDQDGTPTCAGASSTHDHDATYVNEGQTDSVTSAMIVNGSLALADIGQNGCAIDQVMQWNGTAWVCAGVAGATDHGALIGLADDDHPQYFNLAQNETVTGIPAFNGGTSGTTAPFSVNSTYAVADLNADLLDGLHADQLPYWSLTGNAGTTAGTNFLGTTDNQPLIFRTNNTERMRLDTSGRLGIGTVPGTSSSLTIRGAGANSEWLQLMDASGTNQWHLNYLDGGLNFAETSVSDFRLYLEDGGNVGIGIGAPTARLNVQNSTGSTTGRFTNLTTSTGTNAVVGTTTSTTGGTRTGYFHAQGTSGNTNALYAINSSNTDNAAAGYFASIGTTGMMTGIWADLPTENTNGASAAAFIRNRSTSGAGYAGWFVGNVLIQGTLSKSAGTFLIDHPLDPAGKTLSHSFVESPDMMNVYNGNAVLDGKGEAWVQLPDWFEALNKDFRYQLTCIGGFAPVYIAEEIAGNRFRIGGGTPGLKVSWQVTGIRHDTYAEKYPIVVEQNKSAEKQGTYQCPECYGLPRAYVPGEEGQTFGPEREPDPLRRKKKKKGT